MSDQYEGLIERWPNEALLYVPRLPGYIAVGADQSEATGNALPALERHLAWLQGHGYPPPIDNAQIIVVVEALTAPGPEIGPRFESDLALLAEDEIEHALALGRVALSDLIDLADDLQRRPEGASLLDLVVHVAQLDRWYANRLGVPPAVSDVALDPIDHLVASGGAFEDVIDNVRQGADPDLRQVDGEEWTVAKALRRRTSHLVQHLFELVEHASPRAASDA